MSRKARRHLGAAVLVLLATGCGSTVAPSTVAGVAAGSPGSDLGVNAGQETTGRAAGPGSSTGTDGLSVAPPGSATGATSVAGQSAAVPGTTTTVQRPGRAPAAQPAGKLQLGISVWDEEGANKFGRQIGMSEQIGDTVAAAKAVINYINKAGGIAGRQIVPVFQKIDVTSTTPWATERQAECSAFTEDHHVFAVIDQVDGIAVPGMASCLANHKTVYINSFTRDVLDDQLMQSLAPYFYQPGDMSDAGYAVAVDQIVAAGYFDPGYKLGILEEDTPSFQYVLNHVIKPQLQKHGIVITDEARLPYPTGLSDTGQSAATSNAILKFQSEGIDHVFIFTGAGGVGFPVYAESQHYYPRYAMTSKEGVVLEQNNIPADQWHRSVLAGWVPSWDVPAGKDPGGRPLRDLCDKIWHDAGVDVPSRTSEHVFLINCDGLLFLRAALARATVLSAAAVQAGAAALGGSYSSAMTFGTQLTSRRFQGADLIRAAVYNDKDQCFVYTKHAQRIR